MKAMRLFGIVVAMGAASSAAHAQTMKIKYGGCCGGGGSTVSYGGHHGHHGHHGGRASAYVLQPGFVGGMGFGAMSMVPNGMYSAGAGDYDLAASGLLDNLGRRLLDEILRGGGGGNGGGIHSSIQTRLDNIDSSIRSLDTKISSLETKIDDLKKKMDGGPAAPGATPRVEEKLDLLIKLVAQHDEVLKKLNKDQPK